MGRCGICYRKFRNRDWTTVRQRWLDNGGFGSIPDYAIVHTTCDKEETKERKRHDSSKTMEKNTN